MDFSNEGVLLRLEDQRWWMGDREGVEVFTWAYSGMWLCDFVHIDDTPLFFPKLRNLFFFQEIQLIDLYFLFKIEI